MAPQPFLHDLEAKQWEVTSAVGAERQRDDLRAPLERVGHLLDEVSLEHRTDLGERPVHPHLGLGRHGPGDAGRERPVARIGKNPRRIAADRVLHLALDAFQPRVLGVRARQQAAVGHRDQDAFTIACLGGYARVGRRVGRDLLRLRGRTGTGDADVQDVIGCGHPLAERAVDVGARLLHTPALVSGESSSRVRPRTLLSCATGVPDTTAATRSTSASRTSRVRSRWW